MIEIWPNYINEKLSLKFSSIIEVRVQKALNMEFLLSCINDIHFTISVLCINGNWQTLSVLCLVHLYTSTCGLVNINWNVLLNLYTIRTPRSWTFKIKPRELKHKVTHTLVYLGILLKLNFWGMAYFLQYFFDVMWICLSFSYRFFLCFLWKNS